MVGHGISYQRSTAAFLILKMSGVPVGLELLDVYRVSMDFVRESDSIAASLPTNRYDLIDQLRRASVSITLNIAEGAGEFSPGEKARFYRIAKRSAAECCAALDICRALKLCKEKEVVKGLEMLRRIMAMLTALIRVVSNRRRSRA